VVSLEAFSELLQVLYSAPLPQEQRQRFLTLLSEYTRCATGFFISADTQSGLAVLAQGGKWQDPAVVEAYNRDHAKTDPFRIAVICRSRTANPVGVYAEQELVPDKEFHQSDPYRELLGPVNLRYAAISILALSTRRFDAISPWGTERRGPMDPSSRRLLELLVPHVQAVLEVRRTLGVTEQRLACTEAMANVSSTATFGLPKRVARLGGCTESRHSKASRLAYVPAHVCDSSQGERRRRQGCAGIVASRVESSHVGHLRSGADACKTCRATEGCRDGA